MAASRIHERKDDYNEVKKLFRLTADGVAELKAEQETLISRRSEIAEKIKTAREFGDLSENAEYSSAKLEQEQNETRIAEIDHILKNVDLIKDPKRTDKVQLGCTVELKGEKGSKVLTIVGTVEADPSEGKISDESPIGQALLGKKVGETVEIKTPAATTAYKIVKIS